MVLRRRGGVGHGGGGGVGHGGGGGGAIGGGGGGAMTSSVELLLTRVLTVAGLDSFAKDKPAAYIAPKVVSRTIKSPFRFSNIDSNPMRKETEMVVVLRERSFG